MPIPLIVTSPLALSTVATAVLPEIYDTVPSVFIVSLFVNGSSILVFVTMLLSNLKYGGAFIILNVLLIVPSYLPIPVIVTFAVPAFMLFEYDAVKSVPIWSLSFMVAVVTDELLPRVSFVQRWVALTAAFLSLPL